MRITIVNRYFWPESILVNDIARWLVADGHDVTVLTGQPDYHPEAKLEDQPAKQIWSGVKIHRITLFRDTGRGMARNFNTILFVILTACRIAFGRKNDVVWSTSIPPIVQPLALRLATWLRGSKYVYFPQDIYPEIATATGMMKEGFLSNFLKHLDSWVLSRADAVVTISNDMVDLIRERGGKPKVLKMIRSFSPVESPRPPTKGRNEGVTRFVFAGNIGRFQNLDALVSAFSTVNEKTAMLDFLGEGREKANLQARVKDENIKSIEFHDLLPVEDAFKFVAKCDVGIVSLRPEIYRYAFPAKFYTYIGAGLPMLIFVERNSELARITEERGIGIVVGWDEGPDAVSAAIEKLSAKYDTFQANIYAHTEDLYLPKTACEKWTSLFRELEADIRS